MTTPQQTLPPRFRNRIFLILSILGLFLNQAQAADWPWFQGPDSNSTSPETGLARTWPSTGPRVLWTVPVEEGYASAAIRDGQVYLLDRIGTTTDTLRVFDLENGRELWSFSYEAKCEKKYPFYGSRSTPAVTEDSVYITGAMGDIHAIDRKTHQPIWKRHILKDFEGATFPNWAVSTSPAVYQDKILVSLQNHPTGVVALDRKTGKTVWQTPADSLKGLVAGIYHSPRVLTLDGVDQIVMWTVESSDTVNQIMHGHIVSFSAADGHLLWSVQHDTGFLASPVAVGANRVLLTGDYTAGTVLIEVKRAAAGSASEFETKIVFDTQDFGSQLHMPILYKDHFYLTSNGNKHHDGLVCVGVDGKMRWQTSNTRELPGFVPNLPNFDRGNLILAGGLLYVLDSIKGDLRLLEPSPEGYRELGCAPKILDGKEMWAPMALSNGKLVIRDKSQMKCLDVKKP
ncbi:MAG TPA: PQQ-binding-like beta-propeller repeat protein [Candidatus Sumerlaeota bacterium]|nr:PQQ-binding-like beta-propeller repeat protein [Candidatus Sumerlaeota bacterium]HPS02768.1 PQQ-binding-like beta-propeller repeat protein [Candidatus Sumerlaeota bacterium]